MGKQKISKKQMLFLGGILAIVILAILILPKVLNPDGGKVFTVSESSLEELIAISDLSTVEYTYNGVADVYDENNDKKLKYHVAYKGNVTAGIDFNEIKVLIDDKSKKITVKMPTPNVQSVSVDMGKLEYIFEKSKYETETVSQEAYSKCVEDLETKANSQKDLLNMAKENAISAVNGLIEPWVKQIDDTYTIEIK